MKNALYTFAFVTALSACSPQPAGSDNSASADCVFPDTSSPAPAWVCDGAYPDTVLTAVGTASIGDGGLPQAKQQAVEQAKIQLAARALERTEAMITDLLERADMQGEQRASILRLVREQVGPESLSRGELLSMASSERQQLFVLIGLNERGMRKTQTFALDLIRTEYPGLWRQISSALAEQA